MLSKLQKYYLKSMDIDLWENKKNGLEKEVNTKKNESRKTIIRKETDLEFYVNSDDKKDAVLMVLWDEPNIKNTKDENLSKQSHQLCNGIKRAFNLDEKSVCIMGLNKDSINEADRKNDEFLMKFTSFFKNKIKNLNPSSILILGNFPYKFLLGSEKPFSDMRGCIVENTEIKIPLFITYHPSYLVRQQTKKKLIWNDIINFKNFLILEKII